MDYSRQAPLSMGFSRQEYWSGLLCLPPRDLPGPWMEPTSLVFSTLAGGFFTTEPPGKLLHTGWERYKNSQKERRELRWSLGQTQCSRGQAGAWNPFALFLTRQKWCLPAQPEPSVVLMGIQQTVALQIKVPLLADSDLGHSPTTSTPHPHCPRQ